MIPHETWECLKCCKTCLIDGEYPKFFAWCDTCGDYAKGFDVFEYGREYTANTIDAAMARYEDDEP